MADEFVAEIRAELDTKKLESQLASIKPTTAIKVPVEVNTKDIVKQIEDAVKSAKNIKISVGTEESSKKSSSGKSSGNSSSESESDSDYKAQAEAAMKQLRNWSMERNLSSIVAGSSKIISSQELADIREYISALEDLRIAMREAFESQDYKTVVEDFAKFNSTFTKGNNVLSTYKNYMSEVYSTVQNMGKYSQTSNSMQGQLTMFEGFNSESLTTARAAAQEYKDVLDDLYQHFDTDKKEFKYEDGIFTRENVLADKAKLKDLSDTFKTSMSEIKAESSGISLGKMFDDIKTGGYEKVFNDLTNQINRLGEAGKTGNLASISQGLSTSFSQLQAAISTQDLDQIIAAVRNFENEVDQAKSALNNFGNDTGWLSSLQGSFNAIADTFNKMFGATFIYKEIRQMGQEMISTVTEIDTAMNQLQIVTGATESEMSDFFETAIQQAKDLGQSVTDVLDSIQVYSRLGYDLGESSELAEYTSILSNVAAVETEEATQGLTSVIKGFDMSVDDAEHVADVLIEVGQNYAVSASEILEAFTQSSAAFGATGTTFEEASAIIAAGMRLSDARELWKHISKEHILLQENPKSLMTTITGKPRYDSAKAEKIVRMNIWREPKYFYLLAS